MANKSEEQKAETPSGADPLEAIIGALNASDATASARKEARASASAIVERRAWEHLPSRLKSAIRNDVAKISIAPKPGIPVIVAAGYGAKAR